jgi:signal transduction histidine kinase
LKYGQKTTQFRASFEKMDGKYKLVFEDDGVGIPNSMKTQLFSRGFGKNTGLGLFLVKKIIEGYGWQVEEKGEETKGAKFVFIIPEKNVCVK